MLSITRRPGQRIVIGDDIVVEITEISGSTVRLSIDAPRSVRIYREEIWLEVKRANEEAARAGTDAVPEGGLEQVDRLHAKATSKE